MADQQLYLAIGVPCLPVLAGLVISLFAWSGVREYIREIRGDFRRVREDYKTIISKLGALDVELAKLMDKVENLGKSR